MKKFKGQAIIFDKDGTLIDFDAMWGGWVIHLAEQLFFVTGIDARAQLCLAMGYDEAHKKVLADGKLAASPMGLLYSLTVEVMQSVGLCVKDAELAVKRAWSVPDPVKLAKPFTDTRALFKTFHQMGIKVAIATSDDRSPTQALLESLYLEEYVCTMICADDGIEAKPAPDMVLLICERLCIVPNNAMLVADTAVDLMMGRTAGLGLVVGTLSGVSSADDLAPFADVLINSIEELPAYVEPWKVP
jgi:phosphoglycolate phosphatase-like HAD superfamily hydrolase